MTKILVVDDKKDNLIALKALINNLEPEYEILTAASGIEGIELAKSKQPDTILLDVQMPKMDGYEVCLTLRVTQETKRIPIIFLTAVKTSSSDRIKGLELGGDAYLTKPIDEGELLANLHAMLRIKKVEDELKKEKDSLEVTVAERTKDLQESEAKYIDLYDNAPDMFVSVDALTSRIRRCNQTLADALGYKKEEIIGQLSDFVYHPDCFVEAEKAFQQFVDTGEINDAELQLKRKDGSKIEVSLNVSAIRNEEGQVLYSRSIWRDITDRKQTEEALRESEERFRRAITDAPIPIMIHAEDGEVLLISRAWTDLTNYVHGDIPTIADWTEKAYGKRMEYIREIIDAVFERNKPAHDGEFLIKTKSGENRTWDFSSGPLNQLPDGRRLIISMAMDITEKKKFEQELKESANRFERWKSSNFIGIIQSNSKGDIIDTNDKILEMLGYSRKDLEKGKMDSTKITPNEFLPLDEKAMVEACKYGSWTPFEKEYFHKDGHRVPILIGGSIYKENPDEYIVFIIDLTKHKQAEIDKDRALKETQNANKVKNLFLANMSHEIRTPLNTILGFTELIEDSTRDKTSDEEKDFFNVIKLSGNRLMQTIHEILDISQIEAGTYVNKIYDFDLVQLVQELVDGMQIMAKEKKLKLEFRSTRKYVQVRADRDGIYQSISNIMDNAIKYTSKGKIVLSLRQTSGSSVLKIKDTGIGMSQDYISRLFKAFTQESEGYTKRFQGIGLGMSIAKRHLDLNKVDIAIDSTQGKGTTITLTFPNPKELIVSNPENKSTRSERSK